MNDSSLLKFVPSQGVPPTLLESMKYSLLGPGKRIRSRLSLASASYLDLPLEAAERLGVSIEMIHSFTLIHDDLPCMDDDDIRRGKPSNHKVYGEAMALLAGNALMSLGYETFWGLQAFAVTPEAFQRAFTLFFRACGPQGVLGGQAFELTLPESSSYEDLLMLFTQKTGALFDVPIQVPALLLGLHEPDVHFQALKQFSEALGFAFQVADDLEDETQDQLPDGTYSNKSILHYLSAEDARSQARLKLQSACGPLSDLKSEAQAQPLLEIAQEVLHRI